MATVRLINGAEQGPPTMTVRDDRGTPITELELPAATDRDGADEELRIAGWVRGAAWTAADDGWIAPVISATEVE